MTNYIGRVDLLPLTVRYRRFEPASGLIRRLATRAGYNSPSKFLRTVRSCPSKLLYDFDGGRSLDVLGRLSGFSPKQIAEYTLQVKNAGTFVANSLLTASGRGKSGPLDHRGRICPLCLEEDLATLHGPPECRPFRRFWWDLQEFLSCPEHQIVLLQECPSCCASLKQYCAGVRICNCGYDFTQVPTYDRVSISSEGELLSVLLGSKAPRWAKGMSIRAIAGLTLRVGCTHFFGPHLRNFSEFSSSEKIEIAHEGWEILKGGISAFRAELSRSADIGNPQSLDQSYGEIYRWLKRTQEPGLKRFKTALVRHAQETIRPNSDISLFGKIIPVKARNSNFSSPPMKDNSIIDGKARMREVLNLTTYQLARYLEMIDCDRVSGKKNQSIFNFAELERFLAEIERGLPVHDIVPPNKISVMRCGSIMRQWPTVVREVRYNRLPLAGILGGEKGLKRWIVDGNMVKAQLPLRPRSQAVLYLKEACARLKMPPFTVSQLHGMGFIEYGSTIGPSGCRTTGPTIASIENFEREFITDRECATLIPQGVRTVRVILARMGVRSVTEAAGDIIAVYFRGQATDALTLFNEHNP